MQQGLADASSWAAKHAVNEMLIWLSDLSAFLDV